MLLPDAVMGARQPRLEIREDPVHPWEMLGGVLCWGIALSTLGRRAITNPTFFERMTEGHVTVRSLWRVIQYLSDNWPEGLEWPKDVDRPAGELQRVVGAFEESRR